MWLIQDTNAFSPSKQGNNKEHEHYVAYTLAALRSNDQDVRNNGLTTMTGIPS